MRHVPPAPLRCKSLLLLTLSTLALAGCGGGEDGGGNWFTISASPGGNGTLGSFFMASITNEWRDAAASFRANNPRYIRQNGTFTINGRQVFANPLHSSRVDYAHALGLTGAGQVIAIVDDGFRATHETIAGRVIATTGSPILEDHGALVASVAAGSSGSMVGVAPGASLVLSDWGNLVRDNLRLAAIEARNRGAVAQNNSWGYTSAPANLTGYNLIFGDSVGQNWLAALRNYVLPSTGYEGGVVVFAISNTRTATVSGIMDGLPLIVPELEPGWIAVGNAIPIFNDNGVSGVARLESSPCNQSGPWCIMADGAWVGASAVSNTSYQSSTGSSFAAPQVSGALALLAEAFPNLTPHQLRLRLLASADNTFTGFSATGTLDLDDGPGVFNHDWSLVYGHGFLDIRAALLPIGQTGVSLNEGEVVSTKDYAFSTGGAMGDAVTRALEGVDVTISDQLGGDFAVAAKEFATPAEVADLGQTLAAQTFAKDYRQSRTQPLSPLADTFAAHPGQSMELASPEGARASVLMGGAEDYGIALSQRMGDGDLALDVGIKLARDGGSLMGFSGSGSSGGASMASLTLALSSDTGEAGGFFALSGELGVADLGSTTAISSTGQANFNAVRLDVGGRDVFSAGDRISFGVAMPIAVTSGAAEMLVPVRTNGGAEVRSVGIDLAPQERQMDLSISYAVPMGDQSEFRMEVLHAENYGNVAGASDSAAVIGMKWSF